MPSYPHRGPASHARGDRAELGPVIVVGDSGTPARRSWLSSPTPKPFPLRLRLRLRGGGKLIQNRPRRPSTPPGQVEIRLAAFDPIDDMVTLAPLGRMITTRK